jgi:glycosyltransferase involved in cell wall biosynthesis
MAQGRLVAASDVGGHIELIQDAKTGVLFKAGDPDALADKIVEFISRRELWPDLRAAARNFVETQRSWPASVARYEKIYSSLAPEQLR